MRILLAPDKFKGSLTAAEVCQIIADGLHDLAPGLEITSCPIADGGEGFAAALCQAMGGVWINAPAHDALGRPIMARYARSADCAVMEMSAASGIALLKPDERNPWKASTFGTGEMLLHAANSGASEILIGIGGSATNDAGIGMALALGYRFLDGAGRGLSGLPEEMEKIERIVPPNTVDWPPIKVACDVTTTLLGEGGATRIFGPQKGVVLADFEKFEQGFSHLIALAARDLGVRDAHLREGSGAAGGLGWGLMAFAGAELLPGFDIVSQAIGLEAQLRAADLVITGEGKLDSQSAAGKGPVEVAHLARQAGKPCVAIAGSVESGADSGGRLFAATFSLTEVAGSAAAAISRPDYWLAATVAAARPRIEELLGRAGAPGNLAN